MISWNFPARVRAGYPTTVYSPSFRFPTFRYPMSPVPSLSDIYNFRQVSPDLASSGQPREHQLAAIAEAGYNVVINLALHNDPRYSLPDEAASVRALGLDYVHIPVQFGAPTESDLEKSLRRWINMPAGAFGFICEHARFSLSRAVSNAAPGLAG